MVHNNCAAPHGNSYASTRVTTLYRLVDTQSGEILKYGISSSTKDRYSKTFLEGKALQELANGPRIDMARLERLIVETSARSLPLNREPWSPFGRGMRR